MKKRCEWGDSDPLYIQYHDKEWGVPMHDDERLFEFLILEGMQAGLSWLIILKKRENFRVAMDGFDPKKIAKYKVPRIEKLLKNPGIVRNKLKLGAAVTNAKAFLEVQKEFRSFDNYIWRFVGGKAIRNHWQSIDQIPAKTDISDVMSKDLKKRGFKFVGSTICYSMMQAVGMVNDHIMDCFRYKQIK